jgi:hypothetical protein
MTLDEYAPAPPTTEAPQYYEIDTRPSDTADLRMRLLAILKPELKGRIQLRRKARNGVLSFVKPSRISCQFMARSRNPQEDRLLGLMAAA